MYYYYIVIAYLCICLAVVWRNKEYHKLNFSIILRAKQRYIRKKRRHKFLGADVESNIQNYHLYINSNVRHAKCLFPLFVYLWPVVSVFFLFHHTYVSITPWLVSRKVDILLLVWCHFDVTESWNKRCSRVLIFSRASFHLADVVTDAEKSVASNDISCGSRVAGHDEMDRLLRSSTRRR